MREHERRAVATHEAGHVAVAHRLRLPVHHAAAESACSGEAAYGIDPSDRFDLVRAAMVTAAGPIAEHVYRYGGVRDPWEAVCSSAGGREASALIDQCGDLCDGWRFIFGGDPEGVAQCLARASDEVIRSSGPLVTELQYSLARHRHLGADRLDEIFGHHDNRQTRMVRWGPHVIG